MSVVLVRPPQAARLPHRGLAGVPVFVSRLASTRSTFLLARRPLVWRPLERGTCGPARSLSRRFRFRWHPLPRKTKHPVFLQRPQASSRPSPCTRRWPGSTLVRREPFQHPRIERPVCPAPCLPLSTHPCRSSRRAPLHPLRLSRRARPPLPPHPARGSRPRSAGRTTRPRALAGATQRRRSPLNATVRRCRGRYASFTTEREGIRWPHLIPL
jgi:hypothetical protein